MMEILDPTLPPGEAPARYAPRPPSLAGLRVGLVENTKHNSDRLLQKLGDVLQADYGVAETRLWRKHNASVPAHQEILDALPRACDAVVAGVGD
jgi:hypothetical protein